MAGVAHNETHVKPIHFPSVLHSLVFYGGTAFESSTELARQRSANKEGVYPD